MQKDSPMRPSSSLACPLPVPLYYSHIPWQQSYLKLLPWLLPCCFTYRTRSSHLAPELPIHRLDSMPKLKPWESTSASDGPPMITNTSNCREIHIYHSEAFLIHASGSRTVGGTSLPLATEVHFSADYHPLSRQPLCLESRWLGEIASLPSIRVECLKGRAGSVLAFLKCFPSVNTQKVLNLISRWADLISVPQSVSDHQLFLFTRLHSWSLLSMAHSSF